MVSPWTKSLQENPSVSLFIFICLFPTPDEFFSEFECRGWMPWTYIRVKCVIKNSRIRAKTGGSSFIYIAFLFHSLPFTRSRRYLAQMQSPYVRDLQTGELLVRGCFKWITSSRTRYPVLSPEFRISNSHRRRTNDFTNFECGRVKYLILSVSLASTMLCDSNGREGFLDGRLRICTMCFAEFINAKFNEPSAVGRW